MNPFIILLIALLIPVVVVAAVFLPFYISVVVAVYMQYGDAILPHKYNVSTIFDIYGKLFEHWQKNSDLVDLWDFTAPTLGIPAIGILLSLYGTYRLVKYVRDIFTLSL